jgi:hypothetical protein
VLFLISELDNGDNYAGIHTGAVVVSRADKKIFREHFLRTYTYMKYRSSTLFHFKLLYRYRLLSLQGDVLPDNWDLSMDKYLLKTVEVTDLDRKIIMPAKWVLSASYCEKAFRNAQAMGKDQAMADFPQFLFR